MEAVAYTNFRKELKTYFKQVNEDRVPLFVTNKNPEDDVVVLAKDDYDSIMESVRIMSNKQLMAKINKGDEQFAKGKGKVRELIDD
ncbi:type II toxin-antitoxin system Phd/YefM family antitoxin [Lactococcus termiticola]|uniref:Antitoxin n=1 Tax=Lactococcus termiticola TaxID=2169526 RepID=A0A2R5HKG3_9LACT|nr:type II toxin-antitoxin system prevent-host-death family antitoxin [Lactococcus termiticola]GBG97318.1 prevent-host-death protein [Lactococcus termiticola]